MRGEQVVSIRTADGTDHAVIQEREPRRAYGMSFHTVFTNQVAALAFKITSAPALRLLLILPEHLSYTDFRRLNQCQVAAQLNVSQSAISKAMTELHTAGVVERQGKGTATEWRLSLDYGWRGTVDGYHAEKGKRPSRATKRGPLLVVAEGILWNFEHSQHHAGTSSTRPSHPGSMPGGRFARSHAQSMSTPICVSTVRRGRSRATHSSTRAIQACVRCGA